MSVFYVTEHVAIKPSISETETHTIVSVLQKKKGFMIVRLRKRSKAAS